MKIKLRRTFLQRNYCTEHSRLYRAWQAVQSLAVCTEPGKLYRAWQAVQSLAGYTVPGRLNRARQAVPSLAGCRLHTTEPGRLYTAHRRACSRLYRPGRQIFNYGFICHSIPGLGLRKFCYFMYSLDYCTLNH